MAYPCTGRSDGFGCLFTETNRGGERMSRDWAAYAKSTYQWEPEHEKMLRITKTSLTSDFDFCPKQYEYKRVHRLPEPTTDAMTKGTNVHDAVEVFYDSAMPIVGELYKLMQRDKREEALALALSILPEKEYTLGEEPIIETRIRWDLERLLSVGPDKYLPIMNELEVHAYVVEEFEFNGEHLRYLYTMLVVLTGALVKRKE